MPLYIVRWPNLSASIVRAEDEDELKYILDEVDDPGGCRWEEYDGPVWVDFEYPIDFEIRDDSATEMPSTNDIEIRIQDAAQLIDNACCPNVGVFTDADTAAEMTRAASEYAFPALYRVGYDTDDEPTVKQIEEAARLDLKDLVSYMWRIRNVERQKGTAALRMKLLGTSIPFVVLSGEDEREMDCQTEGVDIDPHRVVQEMEDVISQVLDSDCNPEDE